MENRPSGCIWLLSEGKDTCGRRLVGHEVDVGEFGQGVSDLLIECALADLSAFDVGDRNPHGGGDAGWSQHLVAIGHYEHDVERILDQLFGESHPEGRNRSTPPMPARASSLSRHSITASGSNPSDRTASIVVPRSLIPKMGCGDIEQWFQFGMLDHLRSS